MSWHLFHRYEVVAVQHSTDVSFGDEPGIPHTRLLLRCVCGRTKSRSISGTWSLADLLSAGSTQASTPSRADCAACAHLDRLEAQGDARRYVVSMEGDLVAESFEAAEAAVEAAVDEMHGVGVAIWSVSEAPSDLTEEARA